MSQRARRIWLVLLCTSTMSFAAACGSDDDDPDPVDPGDVTDLDTDPGTDTDNDVDTDTDTDTTDPLPPCRSAGESCSDPSQSSENFLCDAEMGQCLSRCDAFGDDFEDGQCAPGSICVGLEGAPADERFVEPGACLPGDCTGTFFSNDCGASANCLPVGNGASFCLAAGPRQAGEVCSNVEGQGCGVGLVCSTGVCEAPCDSAAGNADCEAGLACLPALRQTGQNRPGLCRAECGAFSEGECPEGSVCQPYGTTSIRAWGCEAAEGEIVGEGEACGSAAVSCAEGTICVNQGTENEPDARCLGYCSTSGQGGAFATCPSDAEIIEVIAPTEFGSVSDHAVAAEGSIDITARAGEDAILSATLELADGEILTLVAIEDEDDGITTVALDDIADFEAGDAGVRALHAAPSAPAVDVAAISFPFGELATFAGATGIVVPAGEVALDVYAAGGAEALLGFSADVAEGSVTSAIAYLGDEGAELGLFPTTGPDFAGETDLAALRVFHGLAGAPAVDIYVNCGEGFAGCAAETGLDENEDPIIIAPYGQGDRLATGIAFETLTDYLVVESGTYEVFVVVEGTDAADFAPEDVLVAVSLTLEDEGVYTVGAVAGEGDDILQLIVVADTWATTEQGEAQLGAYHFAGAVDAVELAVTEAIIDGLAYGEILESEDGGFLGLTPGDVILTLSVDGDEAYRTARLTLEAEALYTIVFAGDLAAETFGELVVTQTLPTLADGEAAVAFFHAVPGAGAVRITTFDDGDVPACVPSNLTGLGFCREGCTPYPRRAEYDCDDENALCLPYVIPTDGSVPNTGYCVDREAAERPNVGDECDTPGAFAACQDGICIGVEENRNECLGLCQIFSEGECAGDAVCLAGLLLQGVDDFAICLELPEGNNVGRGNPCSAEQAGAFCGDFAVCLQTQQAPPAYGCTALCRSTAGFNDCGAGSVCQNVSAQIPGAPSYLGICL